MEDTQTYHTVETGYPSPFELMNRNPNSHNMNQRQRFKVIDDPYSFSDRERKPEMPMNSSYPKNDENAFIPPYSHMMKKKGNTDKLQEIFGNNQSYNKMREYKDGDPRIFNNNNSVYEKGGQNIEQFNRQQSYRENYQPVDQSNRQPQIYQPNYQQSYQQSYPPNQSTTNIPSKTCPRKPVNNNMPNNIEPPKMKYIEYDQPVYQPKSYQQNINQKRAPIYKAISDYFPFFVMTKVDIINNHSIYKGIVSCMLCDGDRYIIAIVKNDSAQVGSRRSLDELQWESFQTRYQDNDKDIIKFGMSSHSYSKPENTILDDTIRLNRQTTTSYLYQCDNLPLSVELLKNDEKDHEEYNETGTVSNALEQFSTILTFI
jgi:hypothetical protein